MVKETQIQNRAQSAGQPAAAFGMQSESFTTYGPFNAEHMAQVTTNLTYPRSVYGTVPTNGGKTFDVRVFGTITPNQVEGLKSRILDAAAYKQLIGAELVEA